MKANKAVSTLRTISIICMLSAMPFHKAVAQMPSDIVCDEEIMTSIEKEIPKMLKDNPNKYGLSELLNHISKDTPKEVTKQLKAVQAKQNASAAINPTSLYDKCRKATLIFGNYFNCGQCTELHTGIGTTAIALTEGGICMTNYHVMEDIIRKNTKELEGDSLFYVGTIDGKAYPVTAVISYSRMDDIAIFKVDTRGDKLEVLPLGESAKVGDNIHIISHPKHVLYYYTQGKVAKNMKYVQEGIPALYRMEVTADFAVGSSGGPVLNDKGQLVGMVASTTGFYFEDDEKKTLQMVSKTTIPVYRIKHLLKLE